MENHKLVSRKTRQELILPEDEAKKHMKLHGRKFSDLGPVEEFTPEEAQETQEETGNKGSRKRALPQGSAPVTETEAGATTA
jgi:hypothetical protein